MTKNGGEAPRPKGKNVHIDAEEVQVTSNTEVPEGHVVVEPPTAAAPAVTMPERDARAADTAEQSETSLRTEGQRRINFVWELTQSLVALAVTGCTLYVAARLAMREEGETAAFLLLSNVFFLVLGTYFSRTNHSKIGGVGRDQEGR